MNTPARGAAAAGAARRVGLLLSAVGALCAAYAVWVAARDVSFRSSAVAGQGKVWDEFGYKNLDGSGMGHNFLYTIRFQDKAGGKFEFMEEVIGRQLPEGKPVNILYSPGNPQNARLADRDGMKMARLVGTPALAFLAIGALLARRRARTAAPTDPPAPVVS